MGERGTGRRVPLNRERVVVAAVALADEKGAGGVTMRALAGRVGVEAMSLYNHVTGREDVLDGMVDTVFGEIELPVLRPGGDWAAAMRVRAASARAALLRHPWAVGLMDSRTRPGPSTLRHHDAVLGALRAGGFSPVLATRAFSLIDSYVYGFVLQELSLPFTTTAELDEIVDGLMRDLPAGDYPHLTEVAAAYAARPDHDGDAEFEFGLGLVLGALRPDEAST